MTEFDQYESTEVVRRLLIALGLEVQSVTNVLIDQETKSQLSFETKLIKANLNPDKAMYISEQDVKFDPINPKCTKVMEMLMGKYLDDSADPENGNLPEVLSYFFDKDAEQPDGFTRYQLNIRFEDGTKWHGSWYLNKVLCYDEAILKLDQTFGDTNLAVFDIRQDEWDSEND